MKAILVSKRFNPGHVSHIVANSKLFEEYKFNVKYSVHDRYLTFSEGCFRSQKANALDYLSLRAGDYFVVWFPSITVLFNTLFVRLTSSATIVYVFHEPYISFASYRQAGFSRMKALKITFISLVNWIICSLSHKVILPSERAYNALPVAKTNPKRYAKINLIFSDEASPGQLAKMRTYISYIGTIAEDHAFEEFVHLMNACICNKTLMQFKFLIATRSQLPAKFSNIIERGVLSGRLDVQTGVPMTNVQINEFYSQSFVIWNAYKRSMQSGVLPKAYMFGTPVLMSTSNQSENFVEGVHGALLSDQYSDAEFEDAILKIKEKWPAMSEKCRVFYLENFDYRALASIFMNFVSDKK